MIDIQSRPQICDDCVDGEGSVNPPTNTSNSLSNNTICTPATFSNLARPALPQRPRTKPKSENGKRKEFVLPTAESAPLALQTFEILASYPAEFEAAKGVISHANLATLVEHWSSLLIALDNKLANAIDGAVVDGTDLKKVTHVFMLAAIPVLFNEGKLDRSYVELVISPFLEKHRYHTGVGNWKQMNAAVKYLQAISRCAAKIGNSAFAISLLNTTSLYWFMQPPQISYLSDCAPVLQMPQFEWARPVILFYIVLGGAKSPIPFARIIEILEPEPWPQRPYCFFPCVPEHCEDPSFSEIREAMQYGVAAFARSVGLDIPSQPQFVETIPLPPNRQWCPSPIQVATVLPHASYPPDVILGEDNSEVSKWYPGFALLLHKISLRVTTPSVLHTMVWNGKKHVEGMADR